MLIEVSFEGEDMGDLQCSLYFSVFPTFYNEYMFLTLLWSDLEEQVFSRDYAGFYKEE